MMHRQMLKAILILTLVPFMAVPASGQIGESDKALASVKESERAPLMQLVNDFLQFQRSQQWDLLYDILSPTYTGRETRDEYLRKHQSFTASGRAMFMIDFSLKRVLTNEPFDGQYSFLGCAHVYKEGKSEFTNAHIEVVYENGVWRVADFGMFASCLPPDLECKQ